MKRLAFVIVVSFFSPLVSFAQMNPQYSWYHAVSIDQSTNTAHSTVTVQGTTNPYNCYYTCGTGTCTIPNCTNASHIPTILNSYGSIGGRSTGQAQSPGAIMNYSTTISIPLDLVHGSQVKAFAEGQIVCTGLLGPFFDNGEWWEVAFTNAVWNGTPAPSGCNTPPTKCQYLVHNNCTAATTPPDFNMENSLIGDRPSPGEYYRAWTAVTNCTRPGTEQGFQAGSSWSCGHGIAWNTALNATMPPYSCTHNP